MQSSATWREWLGKRTKNGKERQRIAAEVGVTPTTIMRWVNQESTPRLRHLRQLVLAVPDAHETLRALLEQEFPGFLTHVPAALNTGVLTTIPGAFYIRILHTHATIDPHLRFIGLCDFILQQLLTQLDSERAGMAAIVASCMPPSVWGQVHSLRERVGRGTPPWEAQLEQHAILLGAESLAGSAVSSAHLVTNAHFDDQRGLTPGYRGLWEESAVAAPIMDAGRIAGSLLVSSTQPDFFREEHLSLIQNYADLLSLAFEANAFYDLGQMNLWLLPQASVQQPVLAQFGRRVLALVKQNSLTFEEAEQRVWQQIEQELFHLFAHTAVEETSTEEERKGNHDYIQRFGPPGE